MLPWAPSHLADTKRLLGDNFWPYGILANRTTLDAQVRWAFEQGLVNRRLTLDEFFADALHDTAET
jgi:4,5-dihydroxyphthalate decarboxylase